MLNCTFFFFLDWSSWKLDSLKSTCLKIIFAPPTCLFLQGWVYNVIPWLAAIPSALGGGYVSDFFINQGIKQASSFFYCGMCFELSYCTFSYKKRCLHFVFFSVGYGVASVRKIMQVGVVILQPFSAT